MNLYVSLITSELASLEDRPIVHRLKVLLHDHTADKFHMKLRIEFIDESVLYTNEYITSTIRKYAFQWQTASDSWLVRWDNVPHFPKIASFPHHRHDYRTGQEVVTDSFDVVLIDVLIYIGDQLQKA